MYDAEIMAHSFSRIFEQALKKSTPDDNVVLLEAEKIVKKGYSKIEVLGILEKLIRGRIDEDEASILAEARDTLCEEDGGFWYLKK